MKMDFSKLENTNALCPFVRFCGRKKVYATKNAYKVNELNAKKIRHTKQS